MGTPVRRRFANETLETLAEPLENDSTRRDARIRRSRALRCSQKQYEIRSPRSYFAVFRLALPRLVGLLG